MSEEEAAAEQPVRWLEPAEEDSGSSDEGGSVAGAGGQGEGGPAGATPGKAAAASAPFDSLWWETSCQMARCSLIFQFLLGITCRVCAGAG